MSPIWIELDRRFAAVRQDGRAGAVAHQEYVVAAKVAVSHDIGGGAGGVRPSQLDGVSITRSVGQRQDIGAGVERGGQGRRTGVVIRVDLNGVGVVHTGTNRHPGDGGTERAAIG